MKNTTRKLSGRRGLVIALPSLILSAVLLATSSSLLADQDTERPTRYEGMEAVKRTVGPDKCGECHEAEVASWKASVHQTSYKSMHKSEAGKAIGKKLAIRRIKRDDACVRCHYTQIESKGKAKVKHGISCESCHGPAKDWIDTHGDFGPAGATKATETAEHKAKRRADAIKAGMNRPDQLYYLAAQCFACHVMDDAKLVDVGGHGMGESFELLTWSQGEVRHNFVSHGGKSNAEAPLERRRVILGLGRLLEVESTMRVLSKAKAGAFFDQTVARYKAGLKKLEELAGLAPGAKELADAVQAAKALQLKPGDAGFADALKRVSQAGRTFAARDGKLLSGLDKSMPAAGEYKGKAHQ